MKQSEGIRGASETEKDFCLKQMRDGICQTDTGALCGTRMQERKEREVKDILTKLDQLMPNVTFTDIKTTTCAKNSKATIVNHQGSYCVGDHLTIRLDLFDFVGKKKEYGGDFLRARVYSASLKAGASGHIKDYRNGTYLVDFTLFWEGNVRVSLLLIHPSEGVSALWAARKKGYDKIAFTGRFLSGTLDVSTECGFNLTTKAELCEYLDERDGEAFYCVKPKNVPCDAFVQLMTSNKPVSYLTKLEQSLFHRNNIGVEIPQRFGEIRVLPCNRNKTAPSKQCSIGMRSPFPSGFVWQDQWYPVFCSMSNFGTLDQINNCLKRKLVYFMGDVTVRRWMEHLTNTVSTLKHFDIHETGKLQNLLAVDTARDIQIQWKKHGHPIITDYNCTVKDHSYVAREIDNLAGDGDTAVVISLGRNFRPFPIELFIRRAINVRAAIERLFLRSPDTKVILKAEDVREMQADPERFSNFHGYAQYLAAKNVFQNLNIGMVDAWDMTIAYATTDIQPPVYVVGNQINMFLTYLC
ncbi:NXPE family member 2-like isoform X2 [Elgaria multicarinata webbii]|uniref:NXPE family member 2-like isoform X2 n=1 Tax=Elgaria multicarinata webbii TaxID=159646 RepID=UPI002FCD619F